MMHDITSHLAARVRKAMRLDASAHEVQLADLRAADAELGDLLVSLRVQLRPGDHTLALDGDGVVRLERSP